MLSLITNNPAEAVAVACVILFLGIAFYLLKKMGLI